jgi:hypothetical protein
MSYLAYFVPTSHISHHRLALASLMTRLTFSEPLCTSPCCLCFSCSANSCNTPSLHSLLDILPPPRAHSFMFLALFHTKHLSSYLLNASCHLHPHVIRMSLIIPLSFCDHPLILSLQVYCTSPLSFHHFFL